MFDAIDANKDGRISHQEWAIFESRAIAKATDRLTVPATEEQRHQLAQSLEGEFKKLDSDGDGSVTFAEMHANNKPSPCRRPNCTQITPGWVRLTPSH